MAKTRFRWFDLQPFDSERLQKIARGMKKRPYSEKYVNGFQLDVSNDRESRGRFIEKFEYNETVADPLSGDQVILRTGFNIVEFTLQLSLPHMEVLNGPRSLSLFLNLIGSYIDYSSAMIQKEVDVLKWIKKLENYDRNLVVTKVIISGVAISGDAFADISITGSADVRKYVVKYAKSPCIKFARIQIRNRAIELTSDSRAIVYAELATADELIKHLRQALTELTE